MKRARIYILLSLMLVMVFSCGKNYKEIMEPVEKLFFDMKFKEAGRMLLDCVNKEGKEQLLCMMECGYLLHAGGDFENSNKIYLKAGKLADIIPISITKQVASFIVNQTTTNYRGEDFEKVLLHYFTGINFIMLNKSDEARVEFKKVNNELSKIRSEGKEVYKQNIMAKYMTSVAYEMIGDMEDDKKQKDAAYEFAYVELRQIQKISPNVALIYPDLQRVAKKAGYPEDVAKWTKFGRVTFPENGGEFIFFYESGKGAVKESRGPLLKSMGADIRITLGRMSYKQAIMIGVLAAMEHANDPIPYFKRRSNLAKYVEIEINGKIHKTIMLEDIEETAVKNLEEQYTKLKIKIAASIVTKIAISVVAGLAAEAAAKKAGGKLGAFSGLIGGVVGGGAAMAMAATIQPDLRCWRTLPANLQIARIFLPEGNYPVTYRYISASGSVLGNKTIQVSIAKGKRSFYQLRTLN